MQNNNEKTNNDAFDQLPIEILLRILAYLPPYYLLGTRLNVQLKELIEYYFIGTNKYFKQFMENYIFKKKFNMLDNFDLLQQIDNFIEKFQHKTDDPEYLENVRVLTTVLNDFIALATSKKQDIKLINKAKECVENIHTDKILNSLRSLKFYVYTLTFGTSTPKTINNNNINQIKLKKIYKPPLLSPEPPSALSFLDEEYRNIAAYPNGSQLG